MHAKFEANDTALPSGIDLVNQIDRLNADAWEVRYQDGERTRTLSERAQELSTTGVFATFPYQSGLGASLRNLAYLSVNNAEYDLALSQSLQAFELLDAAGALAAKTDVLCNICWTYRGFGDYSLALDYGVKALALAQEIGDSMRVARVLDVIANIHAEMNNLDQALSMGQKALGLCRELENKDGESVALNNLALTYLQLGDRANALDSGLESLRIAQEHKIEAMVFTATSTVGEIYLGLDDYHRAVDYQQQALELSRNANAGYVEVSSLLNLGKAFHRQHEYALASSYLHQALAITEASNDRRGQFQSHELLAQVYEAQGNLAEALAHYKRFYAVKETVFTQDAARRVAGLQVTHQVETARRDAEIHHLKTIELQKEIEERKSAQANLEVLATTDSLTGLLNRRELFIQGERAVEQTIRDCQVLAAILLDLDHFKAVNDTYGHAVGDQVLAAVAQAIRGNLRQGELVGRYGGDEFAILLPGGSLGNSMQIAERLHDKINALILDTPRGKLSVTASLGVAELGQGGCGTLDTLLDHADQAMYVAKQGGRDSISAYQAQDRHVG